MEYPVGETKISTLCLHLNLLNYVQAAVPVAYGPSDSEEFTIAAHCVQQE
jgi:hypothetical protein